MFNTCSLFIVVRMISDETCHMNEVVWFQAGCHGEDWSHGDDWCLVIDNLLVSH